MPHTALVQHSTAMAKATGDAYAAMQNIRAAGGLPATAMVGLGTLEGALARVADVNAAIGDVAHSLSDDTPTDAGAAKGADAGRATKPVA